ncbi:hypothetical protein [uncultured Shimia sp.]|uniref:hypothetical protein n=1 Tax=uncultured Shimia sp. TaxID=573152 RepID=UPI0026361006|nr:hypothetical protein [uncultured Shimia sp.]
MKKIGALVAIVVFCFGLYYRYDVYQKNQRVERLNDRIAVMNFMTDLSNKASSYDQDCVNFIVKWFEETVAGNTAKANSAEFFAEGCGEQLRAVHAEAKATVNAAREKAPDSQLKEAFIQSALDYIGAYADKGRDHDDIYSMLKTAKDRGEPFGPLADKVNELLEDDVDRVTDAYNAIEAAKTAYWNDHD